MEEKERYEWNSRFDEAIKDNQTGDIVNAVEVLNKQDKRIKELEETNKVLSNELTKNSILKQDHIETCCGIPIFEIPKIKEENQQLKQQLEEKERQYETLYKLFSEQHEIIDQNELECFEEVNRLLKEQKDFYVVEKAEYDKMKQGAKDIVGKLKQQLHDLPKKIVEEIRKWGQKHYNWVGDGIGYDGQDYNECIGFNMAIDQLNEILDTILKKYGDKNESNND